MSLHCTIVPQRLVAILVTAAVVCTFATTEEMASGVQDKQSGLRIVILAGDGAVNVIAKKHPPLRQIMIRVVDEAGKPVNKATVLFQMPPQRTPAEQSVVNALYRA